MATIEITADNFSQTVEKGLVFLDFWASWCGPCRRFGPVFEDASNRYPHIKFGKVSTETQPEIAQRHNIMSIPTVVVYRNGKQVMTQIGAMDKTDLDRLIARAQEV